MATKWTQRLNPLSWITRRDPRRTPVAPGGHREFTTPSAYQQTTQDDYSAADRPTMDSSLEWFAEELNQPESFSQVISRTATINPGRPRTHSAEYDASSQTLRVTFRDGVYDYAGVTPAQWASLEQERTSTGKWLARNGLAGPGSGLRV